MKFSDRLIEKANKFSNYLFIGNSISINVLYFHFLNLWPFFEDKSRNIFTNSLEGGGVHW